MVGWSRRNAEDRRRRARWWASLTPEQQEEETRYQKYSDRRFFALIPISLALTLILMWVSSTLKDPMWLSIVGLSSIPLTFCLPFLFIKPKRKWRLQAKPPTAD